MRNTSVPLMIEVLAIMSSTQEQEDTIKVFLKALSCYDLAPTTGTVLVLDKKLTVSLGLCVGLDLGL